MKQEGYAILKIISLLMNREGKRGLGLCPCGVRKPDKRKKPRRNEEIYERDVVSFDGLACD